MGSSQSDQGRKGVSGDTRNRLPRDFYTTGAADLARRLLGCRVVRRREDGPRLAGIIVETEAYVGVRDRASHAYGGRRTPRNEAMYGAPGTAYVYFTYGMHYCFNVVCAAADDPQAVLIRALEPVEGIEAMRHARAKVPGPGLRHLCAGPARLCQALAIDRRLNLHDLVDGTSLWIEPGVEVADRLVRRSARVGVDYAGAWAARRLRWLVSGSPFVSAAGHPRGRMVRKGKGSERPTILSIRASQS